MRNGPNTLVNEAIQILCTKPLRSFSRCVDMLCVHFGEWVEVNKPFLMEGDARSSEKMVVGRYALHLQGFYRLSCGDTLLFAKADLYQPSARVLADEAFPNGFNWDAAGNNRLDEIIERSFSSMSEVHVTKVAVNALGDLDVALSNGALLTCASNQTGSEEVWRFFDMTGGPHLVMTGKGEEEPGWYKSADKDGAES